MNILFVTSEVASIKKFGGLGDYSAALPKALVQLGQNVDIIMPYYSDSNLTAKKVIKCLDLLVPFAGQTIEVEILKTKLADSTVDVFMVKPANSVRFFDNYADYKFFSFFDKCVLEFINSQFNTYDLIQCNDWHTGLLPVLLADSLGAERPKTLFTIHNLGYQGISPPALLKDLDLIPGNHKVVDWDIEDGDLNMLLEGISTSDFVSTVSPTYAAELLRHDVAGEFADIFLARSGRFEGILNGLDYTTLPSEFTLQTWKAKKKKKKALLLNRLGLPQTETVPLYAFVSRLDAGQKGLDILYELLEAALDQEFCFVLLGTGDPGWEAKFKDFATRPDAKSKISVNILFDEALANSIFEGSDFFLMPSKYEPCGLTQMIAMHYGTPPIVHGVGGLKDSVLDGVTGFVFDTYTAEAFYQAIKSSMSFYANQSKYEAMVTACLSQDFSWSVSAKKYVTLYQKILNF